LSELNGTHCNLCGTFVPLPGAVRWRKDGLEIAECAGCGLLFRARLPGEEEIPEIYGIDYFAEPSGESAGQGYADYLGDEDVHRLVARRRLRLLERLGAKGPLLDIGCAAGFFLDEARARGWSVEGVDVSEPMAEYARRTLGLEVATGLSDDHEAGRPDYGCITMWDYIEHAVDPMAELRRAHTLLAPGSGFLALSTGDASALVARLSGSRWHLLTPRHHMYFFTMATLRDALARAGFEVVYARHPGARYTLRYLVHKLRTMAPDSRLLARADERAGRSRVGRVAVPVNLWDIATVVARPR
jgi:2-polyprenyl-3-methyl-5-hydroxy-6-metoxy-1,4-benzoquinol methylase